MRSRWTIFVVLFVARAAIAFQFQSVAAVAPQLTRSLGASLGDIGVLIGLYFAPGAMLALPGGAIGRRYGDKVTALAGLAIVDDGTGPAILRAVAIVAARGSASSRVANSPVIASSAEKKTRAV